METEMSSTGPLAKRHNVASTEDFHSQPLLNDDCLVKIFRLLPLPKQLWLEQICQHWKNDVVPRALRNVKSLEISDFGRHWSNWRSNETNSHLSGSEIFRKLIDRIGNQLEVISFNAQTESSPSQFFIPELLLLSAKCPNLKKLVLTGDKVAVSSTVLARLGTELSRLESLSIFDYRWSDAAEQNLSLSVGLMSQLKEVAIRPWWNGDENLSGTFLPHLPNSVVSVNIDYPDSQSLTLRMSYLAEFIRSHPGLKKLQIVKKCWDDDPFQELCRETIRLLAQHCSQLEQLSFSGSESNMFGKSADDRSFAKAFESLTQLKKVKFDWIRSFNTAALKSLCANCPLVEDLDIFVFGWERFATEVLAYVGQLKKLKKLTLNVPLVEDCLVETLMSGIGATLDYLNIQHAEVSDASLLQIGLKCSRLGHLVVSKDEKISTAGLQGFIDAIVTQESWDDRSKYRRLHIDVAVDRPLRDRLSKEISLDRFKGRVKMEFL